MIRNRAPFARAATAGLALALAAHAPVRAQTAPLEPAQPPARARVPRELEPFLLQLEPPARAMPAPTGMSAAQLARFHQALNLRASGLLDRARSLLVALDQELPHHPAVLTALAQVTLDRKDFAAAEKLARRERAAARDSVLLAFELSTAEERLGRPRDAIETALEAWVASPAEAAWASATVARLAPADPKGALALLGATAKRLPDRADLAQGLARAEWQSGNLDGTLDALAAADRVPGRPSTRLEFATERLSGAGGRDSSAAEAALAALAGDPSRPAPERRSAAQWAWSIAAARGDEPSLAPRLATALAGIPRSEWDPGVLIGIARGLRLAGHTDQARELLGARSDGASPAAALERALADLHDGPPERALPELERVSHGSDEAMYRFAEALFYSGLPDSALGRYLEVSRQPQSAYAGPAFERIYLIEDAEPRDALPTFGRMAYEDWRGQEETAARLADSLYRALPRGALWAQAALSLSARREAKGDLKAALAPVLAVAESLDTDRLAPVARQRAGDLYLQMKEEPQALAQYEECLARYPRAWNSAEVRRRLEQLRRDRRF